MTTKDARYISCADTAKLIRQALKREFPGTKFSIRSHVYAGGASINVDWLDGPTTDLVQRITSGFAGGRFDGMIDMAYQVDHWLCPDGSVTVARSPGSVSSGGLDAAIDLPPPEGAERVRFGADHVFAVRRYSEPTMRAALEELGRRWPEIAEAKPEIRCGQYSAYITDFLVKEAGDYAAILLQQHMNRQDLRPAPRPE